MKNLARGLALLILILPGLAFSLGLGEIDVSSALNQPIRAEINLLSVHSNELQDLRVTLAPPQAFKRAGIDRPSVLYQLQFSPKTNSAGQAVIQITSKQPIREPFLNFLVEVQWPRGQLLREYTILLDPPVLMDQQHSVEVQTPSTNALSKPTDVSKVPTSQQPVGAAEKAVETVVVEKDSQSSISSQKSNLNATSQSVQKNVQNYETKRGDTLSKIAGDLNSSEGASRPQMMMALLRANPHAFMRENINYLKAGVILRTPTSSELASIDHAEAVAEVSRHTALWREYRAKVAATPMQLPVDQTGRGTISSANTEGLLNPSTDNKQKETPKEKNLKILGGKEQAEAEVSKSVSGEVGGSDLRNELAFEKERAESRLLENEQLKSRVQELEEILSKQEHLISLKSDELTQLQEDFSKYKSEAQQAAQQVVEPVQEDEAKEPESVEDEIDNASVLDDVIATPESVSDSSEPGQPDTEPSLANSQSDQIDVEISESEQPESVDPAESSGGEVVVEASEAPVEPPSTSVTDTQIPENDAEVAQQPTKTSSFMDNMVNDLISNPLILAAVAGTGLLGLFLLFKVVFGSKKTTAVSVDESEERAVFAEQDQSGTTILPEERVEEKQAEKPHDGAPTEVPSLVPGDEFDEKFSVEETQKSKGLSGSEIQTDTESISVDDDKDEVLTEAEVYIAYGMHQQAEELLKEALSKHSQRDDYRLKLLETYFSDQNAEAFDSLAEELRMRQGGEGALWGQALAMGRKINPENSLYSSDFDPGATAQGSGEADIKDSGSGYISDILNELDPEAADRQDEFTTEEDHKSLDFDVEDLHLTSEEESADKGLDLEENATLIDETLDLNLSDLNLEDFADNKHPQDQGKQEEESEGYFDEVEIDVDEGLLEENESDLIEEYDPDIDTQLIQTPPEFDVEIPLDESVSEEKKSDSSARSEEGTLTEVYDLSTEDTQALDLSELGIDFSADELVEQKLDSEAVAPDQTVEISSLSEHSEMPVDDAATEFYDLARDEELSDRAKPLASETMDSHDAEKESAEELSTEIYTSELDEELMQASGDLDENVASDEPTEVSSFSEPPEIPVDDAATEFYDSASSEDLFDPELSSASEVMDSQISGDAEKESAEELSTEIYAPELDEELMQASGDLDENVAFDESTEVSSFSEPSEIPVDDAATEFYDPEHDEDLSDLGMPPASESIDSQISDAAEQESAEAQSTEIYSPALNDELTLGSEVTDISETQASTETYEANFDDEKADESTEIESILGEIPDTVSFEEKEASNEADSSDDSAYWSQEDTFVGEVEGLGFDSDSETQAFDVLEEVGTKLDLAKAYIDMGDAEGARSTLEEVMKEGDDEQCKSAEALMKKIA